ncbi:Protein of unknown function [Mycobacterium canettii CIPT 140070017]|nr:Protein of unknown function [Mycobacterium canettii CIPT 140070017]
MAATASIAKPNMPGAADYGGDPHGHGGSIGPHRY